MFERFTTGAREVVVGAQTEARALGHGWIGTEHLLLAALADEATPVSQALAAARPDATTRSATELLRELGAGQDDEAALRDLGIDLDAVRRRVEERFGAGCTGRAGADGRRRRFLRRRRAVRPSAVRRAGGAHPVHPRGEEGARAGAARGAGAAAPRRSASSTWCSG